MIDDGNWFTDHAMQDRLKAEWQEFLKELEDTPAPERDEALEDTIAYARFRLDSIEELQALPENMRDYFPPVFHLAESYFALSREPEVPVEAVDIAGHVEGGIGELRRLLKSGKVDLRSFEKKVLELSAMLNNAWLMTEGEVEMEAGNDNIPPLL